MNMTVWTLFTLHCTTPNKRINHPTNRLYKPTAQRHPQSIQRSLLQCNMLSRFDEIDLIRFPGTEKNRCAADWWNSSREAMIQVAPSQWLTITLINAARASKWPITQQPGSPITPPHFVLVLHTFSLPASVPCPSAHVTVSRVSQRPNFFSIYQSRYLLLIQKLFRQLPIWQVCWLRSFVTTLWLPFLKSKW